RLIQQLAQVLRALAGKASETLESKDLEELENFLEELTGLSSDMLRRGHFAAYRQMIELMPDPNRRLLAAQALRAIGKAGAYAELCATADRYEDNIDKTLVDADLFSSEIGKS